MKIHVEHRKISGRFSLNRAMGTLATSLEGTLFLKSLKDEASKQLSPFEISLGSLLDIGEQEILICPDRRALVTAELVSGDEHRYLQTVIIFEEDSAKDALLKALSEVTQLKAEATKGTVRDEIQVRKLEGVMEELSANGQKLAAPTFQSVLQKLFDLKIREIVRDVYGAYKEALVAAPLLKKSEVLRRYTEVTNKVLSDADLFIRKYKISCKKCEERYSTFPLIPLVYDSKEAAQVALDSSENQKCGICSEPLGVEESFSLRDIAWQSVQQGLWLEYLTYSVAEKKAVAAFAGRMVGLHELDVVAVLGEEIILFECKDTSLGHNDLFITAGKAQAIGASKVCMITTRDIHDNVKKTVEELSRPWEREFTLEQAEEETEIRSKITNFLENIEKNYIQHIFAQREPWGVSDRFFYRGWATSQREIEL